MSDSIAAGRVSKAILHALALGGSAKTSEPMNALILWTELGRGLCGTLDAKGADVGLLGRIIAAGHSQEEPVDLSHWAYAVPFEARMSSDELASALRGMQLAIERVLTTETDPEEDGGKGVFLAAVKGWFPVGLTILHGFPRGRDAGSGDLSSALRAWCDRYLPKDTSGPKDLGMRVVSE